jgi:hypothetical protein
MNTHGNTTTIDLLNGAQLVLHEYNQSIILTTNDKISFVTRTTEENLVDDVCVSKISIVVSRVLTKEDKLIREKQASLYGEFAGALSPEELHSAQEASPLDQHIQFEDKDVLQTNLLKEALHLEVDKNVEKTRNRLPSRANRVANSDADDYDYPEESDTMTDIERDHVYEKLAAARQKDGPSSLRAFIHNPHDYPGWTQMHPYKVTTAGHRILLEKPQLISDFLKPDGVKLPIDEFEIVKYLKANERKLQLEAFEEEDMKAKLSVIQSDTVSVTSTLTQNDSVLLTLLKNGLGAKSSVTSKKITIGSRNFFIIPDSESSPSDKKQRCLLICAKQSAKSMNPIDFYENKKNFELNISRRMLTPKKGEKPDEKTQIEMESILSHIHNILT